MEGSTQEKWRKGKRRNKEKIEWENCSAIVGLGKIIERKKGRMGKREKGKKRERKKREREKERNEKERKGKREKEKMRERENVRKRER